MPNFLRTLLCMFCSIGMLLFKVMLSLSKWERSFNNNKNNNNNSYFWTSILKSSKRKAQNTTDALPCHIHLPLCLWITDHHSRAPKKNTSHGNEVLQQDITHLIQRPCYQRGSPCQDAAGNPDHKKTSWPSKRDANCSGVVMSPVHQVWPKPSCKAQWKGEEDQADRRRGGKTTSGNGRAWSSPSPRGQWRTGGNGGNWL